MDDETWKVVTGVATTAALLFVLVSCGGDNGYYCVQMERGGCVE